MTYTFRSGGRPLIVDIADDVMVRLRELIPGVCDEEAIVLAVKAFVARGEPIAPESQKFNVPPAPMPDTVSLSERHDAHT